MWTMRKKMAYVLYSVFAKWLPESRRMSVAKKLCRFFAKGILKKMGSNVNIERGAVFSP